MDAEMNQQLEKERNGLITQAEDDLIESAEPMCISFYRQYLQWFADNELMLIKPNVDSVNTKAETMQTNQEDTNMMDDSNEKEPCHQMLDSQ